MTTEEKAKAYDEALEKARFYHGNCPTEPEKKKIEKIFPQLRESEDERIRRTLVEYFGPSAQLDFIRGVPIQKIRDWLEKQKEQKPAPISCGHENGTEWSKEDEDMLNSCISSIEEVKENRYAYRETDGDTSYDHEISWLKSLHPSWKPSEEQMNGLAHAINLDVYDAKRYGLDSLYNDLKKLM